MSVRKSSIFSSIVILILSVNFRTTEACDPKLANVNIICTYLDNGTFPVIGSVFRCRNIIANAILSLVPSAEVTAITQTNGVTNIPTATARLVEALDMLNMRTNFIPNGIQTRFPNLKAIRFDNSQLSSINKENLRQFGDLLEFVWFDGNQLTSLDGDLFEYNPNLKFISFHNNPIRYIHPRFFENLKNMTSLQRVDLGSLTCMNQQYITGNIDNVVWNNGRCFNETARAESLLNEVIGMNVHSLNNESCLKKNVDDSTKSINDNVNSKGNNQNTRMDRLENLVIEENILLKEQFAVMNSKLDIILKFIESSSRQHYN